MRTRELNSLSHINNPEEVSKTLINAEDNSSGSAVQGKVTAANTDDANVVIPEHSMHGGTIAQQMHRTIPQLA